MHSLPIWRVNRHLKDAFQIKRPSSVVLLQSLYVFFDDVKSFLFYV